MFSGSKEILATYFLIHYLKLQFRDTRIYLFTCIIFGGRVVFSAKLQMIQLKCQTFGFTKYKHNVLLLYSLRSWDHLTLGPHSGTSHLQK